MNIEGLPVKICVYYDFKKVGFTVSKLFVRSTVLCKNKKFSGAIIVVSTGYSLMVFGIVMYWIMYGKTL